MAQISTSKLPSNKLFASTISVLRRQGALIALILVLVVSSISFNGFLSSYNILNVLGDNAPLGLIALGMTFVIITGGIDLSVGSTVALSTVIVSLTSPHGMWFALAAAVLTGLAVGAFNGIVITLLRIPPFIATLASLLGVRGLALYFSSEHNVLIDPNSGLLDINNNDLFGVPIPVVILIVAFLLGILVLNYTRFARHLLAIGGNEEAARLLGIRINRTLLLAYMLSGALAGLAGVLLATQTYTGSGNLATGWELSAIASVVVGGTLISGGEGTVFGTFVGMLLLSFLLNILNFINGTGITLSVYLQDVVRGLFLMIVVILQSRLSMKKKEDA